MAGIRRVHTIWANDKALIERILAGAELHLGIPKQHLSHGQHGHTHRAEFRGPMKERPTQEAVKDMLQQVGATLTSPERQILTTCEDCGYTGCKCP